MASEIEAALRDHFMDPDFWRPRLARLERTPRQLVLYPRPEDSRPGTELIEFRLQAHDGERLHALLARTAYGRNGDAVRLRPCDIVEVASLDWEAVNQGITDLIFGVPPGRRLEDRVLDVFRISEAACSIESVDCERVELVRPNGGTHHDALLIAEMIRAKGWA